MSDIEQLRQSVIDTAQERAEVSRQLGCYDTPLGNACNALNEAMKPDPWKLIEALVTTRHRVSGGYIIPKSSFNDALVALNKHQLNQDGAE